MSLNVNLATLSDNQLKELVVNKIHQYEELKYTDSYEKVSLKEIQQLEQATSKYIHMNDESGVRLNQVLQGIICRDESAVEKLQRQRAQKTNISYQTKDLRNGQMYSNRYR